MQGHLSQERRDAPLPLAGQHIPNRRRQIAHPGIQANGPKRIALQTRFSAIRCIPSIYERYREWDIELLFRWHKQHLKIRKFLGENENAIRIQLIAAMIAFVLLRIAAKLHAVTLPALRYAELAGRWIFDRRPLDQIDKPPPKYTPIRRRKSPNQMELSYA